MPGYPNMYIPIVDVRDVAGAHVAAMTAPSAADQRFLISRSEPAIAMKQIGAILKSYFGAGRAAGADADHPERRGPSRRLVQPGVPPRRRRPQLRQKGLNDRARRVLGLRLRTSEQAIIASAESMIAKSLVGN